MASPFYDVPPRATEPSQGRPQTLLPLHQSAAYDRRRSWSDGAGAPPNWNGGYQSDSPVWNQVTPRVHMGADDRVRIPTNHFTHMPYVLPGSVHTGDGTPVGQFPDGYRYFVTPTSPNYNLPPPVRLPPYLNSGPTRRIIHPATNNKYGNGVANTGPLSFARSSTYTRTDESRALFGKISLKPGEDGGLTKEMMNLYYAQAASPEVLAARKHLIECVNRALSSDTFRWGHPHDPQLHPVVVEPFGSVRMGLDTSSSDLDLCILDPYRPNGFEDKFFRTSTRAYETLPDIYDMCEIAKRLHYHGFKILRTVPHAVVPIVKVEGKVGNEVIQIDINTNGRLGVFNSCLITAYCDLHVAVRPLCVFIKTWAKQREMNDSAGEKGPFSFSSYTLILLTIAYLQTLELLPNLQDPFLIAKSAIERSRFWTCPRVWSAKGPRKRHVESSIGWDVTFVEHAVVKRHAKPLELRELARGFFEYYTEFDVQRKVVSIQNGTPLDRVNTYFELPETPETPPRTWKGKDRVALRSPPTTTQPLT
ncbi:hypothetical protein P7C70_g6642, partial [Phenoliferia sp. Uapishka_3]